MQQQRVREVREVSASSRPDEAERMKPAGGVRRSALILRNSAISMFSSSRFSSASELGEDLHCSRQLTVLKIIICDILFSLMDHTTDFLQGINLLYGDLHSFEAREFQFTNLEKYWREKSDNLCHDNE